MTTPTQNTATTRQLLRHRLGNSVLLHGLIGGLASFPLALASAVVSIFSIMFVIEPTMKSMTSHSSIVDSISIVWGFVWLGVLTAGFGIIGYLLRQWLLKRSINRYGMLVYALVCFFAPALYVSMVSVFLKLDDLDTMKITEEMKTFILFTAGFIAGVLCIQIEKRLNKAP